MSESVILYSSFPLSWKEIDTALQAAGTGHVWQEGSALAGSMQDGERAIYLLGDWEALDPEQFWKKKLRDDDSAPEIEAKLGARPVSDLMLQIGHEYGSGLLAVELAYQCALRWPCVVWAETWVVIEGDYVETVYT